MVPFRHPIVFRIYCLSFASLGCCVPLQLLQHFQTGLLEDTRYSGKPKSRISVSLVAAQLPLLSSLSPFLIPSICQCWFNPCLSAKLLRTVCSYPFFLVLTSLPSQFDPDFQTPLILDESLDFSDPEESRFAGAFSDGLLAKSEPFLSMSTFQKPPSAALLGKFVPSFFLEHCCSFGKCRQTDRLTLSDYDSARSLHNGASYSTYGQTPYVTATSLVPSPMADQASQISDCGPYLPNQEYASSYEESRSPMLGAESRQLPEVVSYNPQRGSEGTRVFVQIQCPHDLHSSPYATLYLVFGSKKCECLPHFLGLQGSSFQYALSVDTPPFLATGSPSLAVPLQIIIDNHQGGSVNTLQVGVYTYEQTSQDSPSDESRKRRIASYSENVACSRFPR